MKTYKVLEAHQGDKFYVPGNPETGTRIADPSMVGHLVTLGLLVETGDAPDALAVDSGSGASVADLNSQIEALTMERDDVHAQLGILRDSANTCEASLGDARRAIETLTQERDDARAELETLRDLHGSGEAALADARGEIEALTSEVAELKAAHAKPRGRQG